MRTVPTSCFVSLVHVFQRFDVLLFSSVECTCVCLCVGVESAAGAGWGYFGQRWFVRRRGFQYSIIVNYVAPKKLATV